MEWAGLLRWYTGFWKDSGCRLRCWLRDGCSGRRTCGALCGWPSLAADGALACGVRGVEWGWAAGACPTEAWEPALLRRGGASWCGGAGPRRL